MNILRKLLGLFGTNNGEAPSPQSPIQDPTNPQLQTSRAAQVPGEIGFAFRLLSLLGDGNLVFSPASIWIALGMLLAGARGQTAQALAQGLGVPSDPAVSGPLFGELVRDCLRDGKQEGCQLSMANRLWAQQQLAILPGFLSALRDVYGGDLAQVDFAGDSEGCRRRINQWVEEQTAAKIRNLIPPGELSPASLLVITNGVYFLGKWLSRFDDEATEPRPFYCTPNRHVEVPTMYQTSRLLYARADGAQVVELSYLGQELSMLILLPEDRNGLGPLEAKLTASQLLRWCAMLEEQPVSLFLPRFKMESPLSLREPLTKLGLGLLFGQADFSGITSAPLVVSEVLHKAFVAVDEAGTEAAAATAVVLTRGGPPIQLAEFCADHPFLFLIRHCSTGAILFVGRVQDPTIT